MVGIPAKNVGTATEEFKPSAVTEEADKWKITAIILFNR
jgi:hypothetical protein